jgi:hypothetical protein
MPMDTRQLADLEADLSDEQLADVRFGRSRFLRNASLALFGAATGLLVAQREAEARHRRAPAGCRGAPECHSCTRRCGCVNCRRRAFSCGGNQCWRTRYNNRCFRCCDYIGAGGNLCICRCRC